MSGIRSTPIQNDRIPAVCQGSSSSPATTSGSRPYDRDPAHPRTERPDSTVCPGSGLSPTICPDQAHPPPQLHDPGSMSEIRANLGRIPIVCLGSSPSSAGWPGSGPSPTRRVVGVVVQSEIVWGAGFSVVGVGVMVAGVLSFWRCNGFQGSGFNRR
jgi:hypothetical protein